MPSSRSAGTPYTSINRLASSAAFPVAPLFLLCSHFAICILQFAFCIPSFGVGWCRLCPRSAATRSASRERWHSRRRPTAPIPSRLLLYNGLFNAKPSQQEKRQMSDPSAVQVHWHEHAVSREERETRNGHAGCVVWFTGLSACGKSTVANLFDHKLHTQGIHSFVLDGDNIRHGLNAGPGMLKERHGAEFAQRFGLGFSAQDREENIRRIGAVAKLFCEAGVIAITAFISPYRVDRDRVRATLGRRRFHRNLRRCPDRSLRGPRSEGALQEGPRRRTQGLYGIDDPYEAPLKPELVLNAATNRPTPWPTR